MWLSSDKITNVLWSYFGLESDALLVPILFVHAFEWLVCNDPSISSVKWYCGWNRELATHLVEPVDVSNGGIKDTDTLVDVQGSSATLSPHRLLRRRFSLKSLRRKYRENRGKVFLPTPPTVIICFVCPLICLLFCFICSIIRLFVYLHRICYCFPSGKGGNNIRVIRNVFMFALPNGLAILSVIVSPCYLGKVSGLLRLLFVYSFLFWLPSLPAPGILWNLDIVKQYECKTNKYIRKKKKKPLCVTRLLW